MTQLVVLVVVIRGHIDSLVAQFQEHFITTVDSAALNNTGNSSGGFISRGIKKVLRVTLCM